MASTLNVAAMSSADKIGESMMRAVPKLPGETGQALKAILTPQNLTIMAGAVLIWVGSHVVGIGAIVDLLLLGAGAAMLGWSVFEGAEELYAFAKTAVAATSERDIDTASGHFAKAVLILGVAVIQAVLLRGQARPVVQNIGKGATSFKPLPPEKLTATPPAGGKLSVSRVNRLPPRSRGRTDAFGGIKIARYDARTAAAYSYNQRRAALCHELVHRFFSPKTGPLLYLRATARIQGYERVAFLRYLEEALAQGYAMLRVYGLEAGLAAYRFPVENGYVTISQLTAEGSMIGTILVGGTRLYVYLCRGRMSAYALEIDATVAANSQAPNALPSSATWTSP